MRIAVIGIGAIGGFFGGKLAQAGNDVMLIGARREHVDTLMRYGLRIDDGSGTNQMIRVPAATLPSEIAPVDLVLICVKSYQTDQALAHAGSLLAPATTMLTLQNGWGNTQRIATHVGEQRVVAGLTYQSVTLLGTGHVKNTGKGMTFIGELDGSRSERLGRIAAVFNAAGIETTPTDDIRKEIWTKLAVNVCTSPVAALLRFKAGELREHAGTLDMMRALLHETIAVAHAQDILLDEDACWATIMTLLSRAADAKPSMLQDIERRQRTEIDVLNGAIVTDGERLGIPTPTHKAMLNLIRALEDKADR